MPTEADILAFAARAKRYVARQQWRWEEMEDVVSTMVLDVLTHGPTSPRLGLIYLHARDVLDPRTMRLDGSRPRRSQRAVVPPAAPQATPEERLLLQEQAVHIQHAIAALPERQRQVMQWWIYDQMSFKAIGARLGVTESRVSHIYAKAIPRLQQALRPYAVGRPGHKTYIAITHACDNVRLARKRLAERRRYQTHKRRKELACAD